MGRVAKLPLTVRRTLDKWDPADLVTRLCNALDIAERTVRILAPHGYQDPTDPAVGVEAEKVVSETALLLLSCNHVAMAHPEVRSRVEQVANLLIPHARNERVVIGLCRDPGLARDYTFAHACLSRLGYPDPHVDHLLELSLEAGNGVGRERLPHRMLEQEWLQRVWDPTTMQTREAVGAPAQSVLGRTLDVFAASRDDLYAFTHALMYLTELGERRVRLPRARVEILANAEAAFARCLDEQDYDLCGEILLAWPYIGVNWSATASFGFQVLARVEEEAGFLPAPLLRLDRYHALRGEEQSQYVMATAYHTAYVMGLVCAAALRSGKAPLVGIPQERPKGGVSAVLEYIDANGNKSHWRDDLSKLPSEAQESLLPMLLTIGLRRAVKQQDLQGIRTLLESTLPYKLINHPSSRQAAGMLRRYAAASPLLRRV